MCPEQAKEEGRCAETWGDLGVAEVLGYLEEAFGAHEEGAACTTVADDTSGGSLDHRSSNRRATVEAACPRGEPGAAD